MKNIKEYNTTGLDYFERKALFNTVIPIHIGETVWYAGDCWEYPSPVKVDAGNQEMITMFWNSLYFDEQEKAIKKNNIFKARYGSWQSLCVGGGM